MAEKAHTRPSDLDREGGVPFETRSLTSQELPGKSVSGKKSEWFSGGAAARGISGAGDPALNFFFENLNKPDIVTSADVGVQQDKLQQYMMDKGKIGDPKFDAFNDALTKWRDDLRKAEAGASKPQFITPEIAEAMFNAALDKVAWVRERITAIRRAAKPTGGFSGSYGGPYQELTNAELAIRDHDPNLWLEEQYTFPVINIGYTARGSTEIPQLLEASGNLSAEAFEVMFRLKMKRVTDGKIISGVAEAFRKFEEHRSDYYQIPKDNKSQMVGQIAWELEGYSPADAKKFVAAGKDAPHLWAAEDAHDLWLATLRGIAPDSKDKRDGTVYPAYRLATVAGSTKLVPPFFQNATEGNSYIDPYLVDFWTYIAESKLKKATATSNLVLAGLLVPDGKGGYAVPESLEKVKLEDIDFIGEFIGGIYGKYMAYVNNTDKFRATTEKGGVFTHPDMDTLGKHIADDLWKNMEPPERRVEAICKAADGILAFNLKTNWSYPQSYSQRDIKGTPWGVPLDREHLVYQMRKLLGPPFNISMGDPSFVALTEKYKIKPKDLIPKGGIKFL